MDSLYHQTNNLVQEIQNFFIKLEKCGDEEADSIEKEIQNRIDTITRNCKKLDILIYKEPLARRQTNKSRVDQLKYDQQHLQASLRMLQHKRRRKELELKERDELLQRKFTTLREEAETSIFIDHSIQHQNSLKRANNNLDELISTGTNVLENLREQRVTLKRAQRRLIDFVNTLGLSNTTMRLIENRIREDKWIFLGGMFITIVIIFVVIIYIKK